MKWMTGAAILAIAAMTTHAQAQSAPADATQSDEGTDARTAGEIVGTGHGATSSIVHAP